MGKAGFDDGAVEVIELEREQFSLPLPDRLGPAGVWVLWAG